MRQYEVKVKESSRELTKKEIVMFKDLSDATNISEFIDSDNTPLIVDVQDYVVLSVHNEKAKDSQNVDYENFVVIDKSGTRYYTGSQSFFTSFMEIWDEMKVSDEDWQLKIFKKQSKGKKDFITCTVI